MREPDLTGVDYRTPEQWEQLRRDILLRAEIARAQALRHLFRGLLALLRIAWRTGQTAIRVLVEHVTAPLGNWWRAYTTHRERKAAMRELHSLDDRSLKDMGINRSEIESVVYGGDATRLRDATIAAADRQRSELGPNPSAKLRPRLSTAHLARKSAA
jgi:uncharacterized protein YjiS (DUF1127 family)